MKKTKLILLQLIIAFVLISTSVYATVNTTIALSIGEAEVLRGDTIDVTLSLQGVEADKKIQSVAGYINYDENVIEKITADSIKKTSENKVKIGNEELKVEDLTNADADDIDATSAYIGFNGKPYEPNDTRIVIDFEDGITADTDLLTIKFKVKETATIGEVEKAISYSMFVVTAGSEESEEITKDIKLTVKNVSAGNDDSSNTNNENKNENVNTNKNTNNENTNKNENTNTNKNTNTNNNVNSADNTVSSVKIPAAGAKVVLIPAIILIVLAYVSYNRYMKYRNI